MYDWSCRNVVNLRTRESQFDYSPIVTHPRTSVYLWSPVLVGPAVSSISCYNWDQGLSYVSIRIIGRMARMSADCHSDKDASSESFHLWTPKDRSPSGCSLEDQGSSNMWDWWRHQLAVSRSRFFPDVESEESFPNRASSPV